MKKYVLLIMVVLPLFYGCPSDNIPVPGVDFTTVIVTNDFPMDINSFHYEVTVYRYRESSYATEYRFYSGDLDVNNPTIENVDIPPHSAYQINFRLFSNDCSSSCLGSCVTSLSLTGGYPEYYDFIDNLSGMVRLKLL
jgi:hypothetical protein